MVRMMARALSLLLFLTLLIQPHPIAFSLEMEICGYVSKVVDGDTIWMVVDEVRKVIGDIDVGDEIKIRFADINAPELDTVAGVKAKDALSNLFEESGRRICIDVDDQYVWDKYGRIVAVVMIPGEEVIVVNTWLVENGYAVYRDYPNEFSPGNMVWEGDDVEPDTSQPTALPQLLILLILIAIIILAYRRGVFR